MEFDTALFTPEHAERFEGELVERARVVMDTDELLAVDNLFQLVRGSADYNAQGLVDVGYPEDEAALLGWQAAWSKLRKNLDTETDFTHEIATYMERNISRVNPDAVVSSSGEPLDAPTRTFYRTFIDSVEHPYVHPTSRWLFEND